MSQPRVTIIVPTLKREEVLVQTLRSLAAVDYPADSLEVLVVDQTKEHEGATQRYLEKASAAAEIRWFHPPEIAFASLTKARNFGISKAVRPEFIIFVDDDVEVKPSFVLEHLAPYADPSVGAVAGKVTVPGTIYPAPPYQVGKISWFGNFVDNYHGDEPAWSDNFIGCNFSLRASLFAETGIFDEEFIGNALREDSDMAARVREVGKKIAFAPKASLIHKQTVSGGTRGHGGRLDWYYALFCNNMLFYRKHVPAWRMPFFVLHLARPILACWLYYGKGSWQGFIRPWSGIKAGLAAARRSMAAGTAVPRKPAEYRVF